MMLLICGKNMGATVSQPTRYFLCLKFPNQRLSLIGKIRHQPTSRLKITIPKLEDDSENSAIKLKMFEHIPD
jgi:hypothetical protein